MTTRLLILSVILLLCVGCATTDTVYTEKVNECLDQVKNLSELGGDSKCREIQNEWIFVVKRELGKEIKLERVVFILMAFDFYSLRYLKAFDNFSDDEIDYTMVFGRIRFICNQCESVTFWWENKRRGK